MKPNPLREQSFQELNTQFIPGEKDPVDGFWTPSTWVAMWLPPELPHLLFGPRARCYGFPAQGTCWLRVSIGYGASGDSTQ